MLLARPPCIISCYTKQSSRPQSVRITVSSETRTGSFSRTLPIRFLADPKPHLSYLYFGYRISCGTAGCDVYDDVCATRQRAPSNLRQREELLRLPPGAAPVATAISATAASIRIRVGAGSAVSTTSPSTPAASPTPTAPSVHCHRL